MGSNPTSQRNSALDVSGIYPSDSRHVAPPKSGEDAHVTHGMHDLGGPTLY